MILQTELMELQCRNILKKKYSNLLQQNIKQIINSSLPYGLKQFINIMTKGFRKPQIYIQQIVNHVFNEIQNFSEKVCKNKISRQDGQILLKEFINYPYQNQIKINCDNEKLIKNCRKIVNQYFHKLVHITTVKQIHVLMLLFYKLVSYQMLDLPYINYFLFNLMLSEDNIHDQQFIKIINSCLAGLTDKKIIYVGLNVENGSDERMKGSKRFIINEHLYKSISLKNLSFTVITYIIYLGHKFKHKLPQQLQSKSIQIIQKLLIQTPTQLTSTILSFRNEFPSEQLFQCKQKKKLSSLSKYIIDNVLFKNLLNIYLNIKFNQLSYQEEIYNMLRYLLEFNVNKLMIKNILSKLEIQHEQSCKQQWKKIFKLLKSLIISSTSFNPQYLTNMSQAKKESLELPKPSLLEVQASYQTIFLSQTSGIKYKITPNIISCSIQFRSYRINNQYIFLKLKNQQEEILITIVSLGQCLFKVSAIRSNYLNKIFVQMNPFQKQLLQIKFDDKEHLILDFKSSKIGTKQSKHKSYTPVPLKIHNIKPTEMVFGVQNQKDVLPYICQITNINLKQINVNQQIIKYTTNIKYTTRLLLKTMLKQFGQIDLFLLLCYHLILIIQHSQLLIEMINEVYNLLECIVDRIGVYKKDLSAEQKQYRFYCVRCLVWLACNPKKQKKKQKMKDPQVIFHIFKLLSIRGIKNPMQCLQILCNVGLWKEMSSFALFKITEKIKQQCAAFQKQNKCQIMSFMKKVIHDFVIFYKNNQQLSQSIEQQQQYLIKHSYILKLVYDCMISQKIQLVFDFLYFLLKILYSLLNKTKNNDKIDTLLAFQIVNLTYRLLFYIREQQYQTNTKTKPTTPSSKPHRFNKTNQQPSLKSTNIPQKEQNFQIIVVKIEQILMGVHQIVYKLNNQTFVSKQDHNKKIIKYHDWKWDFKLNSSMNSFFCLSNIVKYNEYLKNKIKNIPEIKILTLCQYIQICLYSHNKTIHDLLSIEFQKNLQIFWEVNLFDDRVCNERIIQTLKYQQYFNSIQWDDKKVCKILTKSFQLVLMGKLIPDQFLQQIQIQNINNMHNTLLSIYLQKCQQADSGQLQKCAENIMYIISIVPDFVYTNTALLRQSLSKEKRNQSKMQYIDMHLIIKQLARQSFKFINTTKKCLSQESFSTIFAFEENKISPSLIINESSQLKNNLQQFPSQQKKNNDIKNKTLMSEMQWVDTQDIQQSFIQGTAPNNNYPINISTQMIKKSLEFFKLLANQSQIKAFNKIQEDPQNENQIQQTVKGHQMNLEININGIIQMLQQNITPNQRASKLQRYIFFIKKQIYDLSKMILHVHIFDKINILKDLPTKATKQKKKSIKNYKVQQQSEQMIDKYLQQRRKSVYMMEKIWGNVEKNNKKLWEIFLKFQQKHQSIDNRCNSLKMRCLIEMTHEKRQIELPKNITVLSNKNSILSESQKIKSFEQQSQNPIFQQNALEQKQASSIQKAKQTNHIRQTNQFFVFYITNKCIYQGVLKCLTNQMIFIQNTLPDQSYYQYICANDKQRRTIFQIQKNRQQFVININDKTSIILKRYLFFQAAVEIYSQNQTKFLFFMKNTQKQKFFQIYSKIKGMIRNQSQLLEIANKQMDRWINGDISNFTYLMHLNDLSGRSFNDLSQYYIFPWILIDYSSTKFNKQFVSNDQCYRNLYVPVGALNPSRFQIICNRFKQSQKYCKNQQMQCFLYGSFCSNPAIVSNYMVRMQPFSMHQYYLQSKQFDVADRIFYSIQDQFNCCYYNSGDFKQLIPQFYYFPQFLRNRNKYNFGIRQDNEIVNNVKLPKWAQYDILDYNHNNVNNKNNNNHNSNSKIEKRQQQSFVFKMKKCLQSQYVTKNLNHWIDLMFGLYTKKSIAKERDNLFLSNIYIHQKNQKNQSQKSNYLIYYKQFGQMPKDLFQKKHKQYNKNNKIFYNLYPADIYQICSIPTVRMLTYQYQSDNKYFIYWNLKMINIVQIKNKSNLLIIPLKQEKPIQKIKIIHIQSNQQDNKKIQLFIYLKKQSSFNIITLREICYSSFWKKLDVKDQCMSQNGGITNSDILEIYNEGKLMILTEENYIKIYEFNVHTTNSDITTKMNGNNKESFIIAVNKKIQLKFSLKFQFNEHQSKIQYINTFPTLGLLISVDNTKNVFILKINSKELEISQHFKLSKLTNCQQIQDIQLHQMCYIIIRTNINKISIYNFMGDFVTLIDGNTLKQINQKLKQKINTTFDNLTDGKTNFSNPRKRSGNEIKQPYKVKCYEYCEENKYIQQSRFQQQLNDFQSQQLITVFKIWNHQSSQLIIGTNQGNIYRIDLFMIDDCEKLTFGASDKQKKSIQFLSVNRIGKHWQCWVVYQNSLFRIQSQDYVNAEKRNEEYKKKYVLD